MLSILQQGRHPVFSEGLNGATVSGIVPIVVKVGNYDLSGLVRTRKRKFY